MGNDMQFDGIELGISRERFEEIVHDLGMTVEEMPLAIRYSENEELTIKLFLSVKDRETTLVCYWIGMIEQWIHEPELIQALKRMKREKDVCNSGYAAC